MEKFRISNDLSIFWSITEKDGSPYNLSDKTVRLIVTHPRGRMDVTSDITVQGNVICWLFRGSKQRFLGNYKITAEIQSSPADRVIKKDIPEAFALVSSSQYEQTEVGRPDINETGNLTLATSLDIFQIKPIIPQVGPNRNWWVDGADTGKSSVGLTAYEFAKEQGYEGTVEEYEQECLSVPYYNELSRIATAESEQATKQSIAQQEEVSSYMKDVAEPTIARAQQAAAKAEQAITSIPKKTSQLVNDSGFITKEGVPASDWNASTYKEGHIKNRTHHMQDHLCHYFKGSPIEISKPSGVGYVLLTYDTDLADKFIRIEISADESKTHEFLDAMGMPLIFRWDADNSTINVESFAGAVEAYGMRAYYSSNAKSFDEYFVTLDDGFIPESVARKSEIATINDKPLTKGGNIVIEGKNYDKEIAELDATKLEGEKVGTTEPTEDFEINAEIKAKLAELSKNTAKISEIENTIGENIDLDSAERIGAFIEQYQSDMRWQQKANTSALVIPVKKGDKYTIVGSGVKSYYALTDKLDYSESYKAISLVDSIGGAINANTTIELVCPSDAYLIVSEIDNKGTNRLPSAISKYLGNIKTAIDEGLKELSSEIDVKIGQNNASVQQSLNGLSAEIAKKITNPSVGANGTVLMSLGNGEVKWANVLPKSGVFYGYFASASSLPLANEIGYAYVGEKAPFVIYNFNGSAWQNSGITTYEEDYKRINVRDFGAIGDGVTNDEDAIRAAFAYAVENLPCEVYFPKGDYGILNGGFPVKIPNGTGGLRISGDGGNLSRIVYLPDFEMTTGEGWYAIRVQPTTTPTNEDGYIHDISIVNMGVYDTDAWNHALNPDLSSGDKEETHGFDIQYAIRARVEGCFIDSVGDECIDIYSCIDTIVTNNITHNSPAAGAAGGAISIGDGSYNVIVSNNIVRGNITTKENFGIAIESLKIPVSRVVIANNTIANLSGTGVKLSTPNDGASISDVSIVGNIVNGCTYGISDEGNYEKKNITIISNVLSDITHTAIYLSKQGNNILIDGCVIDSCQYAMWLNTHTIISNCTISNIYGYVAMVSSDEAIFDNCKIDNVCQDTTSWVIYIYGDEPIVSVRNCSITNIHSSRGLQKMKNVVNTDIYFTASGDAVSGVAITEKVVGVSTNGRISIGKNYAMVRDVSIVSENIGSNAITIAANVIGASVLGCYVNINDYSAIKENSGCDKNLICNNVTNMSVVKVGENSIVEHNIKL